MLPLSGGSFRQVCEFLVESVQRRKGEASGAVVARKLRWRVDETEEDLKNATSETERKIVNANPKSLKYAASFPSLFYRRTNRRIRRNCRAS